MPMQYPNVFYHGHGETHDHAHDNHAHDNHVHDHHHDDGLRHNPLPQTEAELISKSIESLLLEKGFITNDGIERIVDYYKNDVGPMLGAKAVAKAWVNPAYKKRLLENGTEALKELNITGFQSEYLIIKENTPTVHNVIVCTLCSCYPWATLGLPPSWYKSFAYRSRVVIDPRGVLKEFDLELDESIEIHVWDANAEIRYMVLPERPEGTVNMSEEELAALVTRDSMIGVAKLRSLNIVKS
jgi:nitrile hydratase subunit alpha